MQAFAAADLGPPLSYSHLYGIRIERDEKKCYTVITHLRASHREAAHETSAIGHAGGAAPVRTGRAGLCNCAARYAPALAFARRYAHVGAARHGNHRKPAALRRYAPAYARALSNARTRAHSPGGFPLA